MDSSADKPDLNGGYEVIEQYRFVSTWMGFEPETIK